MKPTVSAITDTVVLGETQAPQIAERSAETTLLMRDGETMVIGGLLSDRDIKTMNKVPLLWKIPLFGELFKSEGITKEHSSISVYLRLKLIKDYMGEARQPRNIPNIKVNQLLNGLSDQQIAAANKKSGGFKVQENVQGIIPIAMNNEPARTEIMPATENTAVQPQPQNYVDNQLSGANDEDWKVRYDKLIEEMLEKDKQKSQTKKQPENVTTPAESNVTDTDSEQSQAVKEDTVNVNKPESETPPAKPNLPAPDITDYLY